MQLNNLTTILLIIGVASTLYYILYRLTRYAFILSVILLMTLVFYLSSGNELILISLVVVCPLMLINTGFYVFLHKKDEPKNGDSKYCVNFATSKGNFKLENIKRGASIIGSAGSGKTESVVYGFLKHFQKEGYSSLVHELSSSFYFLCKYLFHHYALWL